MARRKTPPPTEPTDEASPVETDDEPPPSFSTDAPLTWGSVWNAIKRFGFDQDEYAMVAPERRGNRARFFKQEVWGPGVRAVPVFWTVGSNEGYYVWVTTQEGKGIAPATQRHHMTIKVWDSMRAAEIAATLQILVNQGQTCGTSDLWRQSLPIVFRDVPTRPQMDPHALAHMLTLVAPLGTRLRFRSVSTRLTFVLTVAPRPQWASVSGETLIPVETFMVPDDIVFEFSPSRKESYEEDGHTPNDR